MTDYIFDEAFEWQMKARLERPELNTQYEIVRFWVNKVIDFYLPIYFRCSDLNIETLWKIRNGEKIVNWSFVENNLSSYTYRVDGDYSLRMSGNILLQIDEVKKKAVATSETEREILVALKDKK